MRKILITSLILLSTSCATYADNDISSTTNTSSSSTSSSCPYHVYRHNPNGWLITNPVVHFVFWGGYWNHTDEPQIDKNRWSNAIQYGQVFARLSEYGIEQPTLGSSIYLSNTDITVPLSDGGSGNLTESGSIVIDENGVPLEINNEIESGDLPTPEDMSTLYVIFLPPNTITSNMLDVDGGRNYIVAYHHANQYGTVKYAYAIIDYNGPNDLNGQGIFVSHEMYEAFTNPDNSSGYWDDATGSEIGDLCDPILEYIGGYPVQKVWSQLLCVCF